MKLHCPDCGAQILAVDMNLSTSSAKCAACNSVFSFVGALDTDRQRLPANAPAPAILVKPNRMKIEEFGNELTIRWRWFTPVAFFLLFFCIAWDSFLVFWYSMALSDQHAPWLMIVFPVAHVAVGIGLTYTVLSMFLNSTVVRVGNSTLSVRQGPLPFGRNHELPSADIEQLFCESKEHRGENSTTHTYNLFALLRGGKRIKLLGSLQTGSEAKYLEHLLEQRLRIRNRPIVGEMELTN